MQSALIIVKLQTVCSRSSSLGCVGTPVAHARLHILLCAGADSAEEQLQIELPAVLQKQLLDQYDAIHDEGKLLQLPRRPNVMQASGGWGAVCGWNLGGHSGRACLTHSVGRVAAGCLGVWEHVGH